MLGLLFYYPNHRPESGRRFTATFQSNCCLLFTCLQPHARGGAQRGSYGREDGNGNVQNLLPDRFCFHGFSFSFLLMVFVGGGCSCHPEESFLCHPEQSEGSRVHPRGWFVFHHRFHRLTRIKI